MAKDYYTQQIDKRTSAGGWLIRIVTLVAIALLIRHFMQPDLYHTKLPVGTTDLSSIQVKLDELPPADRALIIAYIQRGQTQTLSGSTFADAIRLQKDYVAQQAAEVSQQTQAHATINPSADPGYAPLQEAVSIELVSKEVMPRWQARIPPAELQSPNFQAPPHSPNDDNVLVTTYRVKNTSVKTISLVSAGVDVRKLNYDPTKDLGVINSCSININQRLAADESTEVRCGGPLGGFTPLSPQDNEFLALSDHDYTVEWMPHKVQFDDGTTLSYWK